jgi:hypothetical protein
MITFTASLVIKIMGVNYGEISNLRSNLWDPSVVIMNNSYAWEDAHLLNVVIHTVPLLFEYMIILKATQYDTNFQKIYRLSVSRYVKVTA